MRNIPRAMRTMIVLSGPGGGDRRRHECVGGAGRGSRRLMRVRLPAAVDPVGEPEQQPSQQQESGQLESIDDQRVRHAFIRHPARTAAPVVDAILTARGGFLTRSFPSP
jgi:hypothetical protein